MSRTPPAGTIAGGAIGGLFLAWLAGPGPLDPTNIEWVMKLDWVPHFFGWHYFRTEPWHWPPGAIHGYYAPLGSSIGLTDAIPLAAYVLKPFTAWLPPVFQYLGLWWLLCFGLQGALGARLVARVTPSVVAQVLGAALFVLLPTLLARIGHAALCSHWLILWALLIATRDEPQRPRSGEWAALGLLAGMIQPYLATMVLALLTAAALHPFVTANLGRRLGALAAAIGATLGGWWLSGLFVLSGSGALSEGGLGYFSANLLAPITPGGWSRFLPELPVATDGQVYEGFHYLGLGVLALAVVALALTLRPPKSPTRTSPLRIGPVLVAVCVLMAAFAVSPKVTFGSRIVLDLSSPVFSPLSVFRSSGRFVWPLTYLALAWIVAKVASLPARPATGVLAAAVALQLVDLNGAHLARRHTARDPAFYAWPQPFVSDRWPAVLANHDHLVLAPPPQCGSAPLPYEPVVRLAALHGLTVNTGVIARRDIGARARYCARLMSSVNEGTLDERTVYLVGADTAARLNGQDGGSNRCTDIDGVWVCGTAGAVPHP